MDIRFYLSKIKKLWRSVYNIVPRDNSTALYTENIVKKVHLMGSVLTKINKNVTHTNSILQTHNFSSRHHLANSCVLQTLAAYLAVVLKVRGRWAAPSRQQFRRVGLSQQVI